MSWTDRQQDAIDARGENLLVAAAAGSGKTAVLVERIKKLILQDGVALDEMLIVSFTQAAAAEMKERIYGALSAALKDPATDGGRASFLHHQVSLLGRAPISTFHSFALDVVRRYAHVIGLKPGLTVCDDGSRSLMLREAQNELFDDLFEQNDKDFIAFLDRYASAKDNSAAIEMIFALQRFLESLPDGEVWMDRMCAGGEDMPRRYMDYVREYAKPVVRRIVKEAEALRDMLLPADKDAPCCPDLGEKQLIDLSTLYGIEDMLEAGRTEEAIAAVSAIEWQRMNASKRDKPAYALIEDGFKNRRDRYKKELKSLADKLGGVSEELLREEQAAMLPWLRILCRLTRELNARFSAKKLKKGVLDFPDIEHYALAILRDEMVCAEYRGQFRYIFVDEYQDSNLVQEELIKRIARKDNVFMVGDVKQSIYRFRLADPEIFNAKYALFKSGGAEASRVIDLNSNFRSKAPVIECVNHVFAGLMRKETAGIDYDDDAALKEGVPYKGQLAYEPQLYITETASGEEGIDAEIADLKAAELEALTAVQLIRQYLGLSIYDAKLGRERPIRYGDMAVLLRAAKNDGEVFYKAFTQAGIPVYLERSEGYFDTLEISVFLNLLRLIDNRRQDLPLLSVLRCPIFGFDAEKLARIRIFANQKGPARFPYIDAFELYCSDGDDEYLRLLCQAFRKKLDEWRRKASFMPLGDFLWELLNDTGFALFSAALPSGTQRMANLRALVDRAQRYETEDTGGLYGFISYIDALNKRGQRIDAGQVKVLPEGADCVRIMTVHKSKGLEFPFVLLAGLGKGLHQNQGGQTVRADFHKDIGMGIRIVDPATALYNDPVSLRLIGLKKRSEEDAEQIRILYVAMTRAKDLLVLSGTAKDAAKVEGKDNYLSMVAPYFTSENKHIVSRAMLAAGEAQAAAGREKLRQLLKHGFTEELPPEATATAAAMLGRAAMLKEGSGAKRKYSVSELAQIERLGLAEGPKVLTDQDETPERLTREIVHAPNFLSEKRPLNAAEKGTAYHAVMEHIPFTPEGKSAAEIQRFIEDLQARGILTEGEANAVEPQRIADFFTSDIGCRAMASKEIHKEAPFVLRKKYEGREIYVQGTIDCYFREGDHYVLIDYKSNYIDREDEEGAVRRLKATYLTQLALYREALERITHTKVSEGVLYLFALGREIQVD